MSEKLSVIVIAKNEEHDLPACLESVRWADEIVLVDDHSTDKTREIAKRFTDKIFERSWDGFGPQKQYALERAQGPWVLSVDADERVTPDLAQEIRSVLSSAAAAGYRIPFQNRFFGRRLRFGRSGSEEHVRLFRKDKSVFGGKVHEGVEVSGPLGRLKHTIVHESYRDLKEYFEKMNLYTSLIAQRKRQAGERFHFWQVLRFPWEFFSGYVLRLGFLDGWQGFLWAWLSAQYAFTKHLKVWDLQRKDEGGRAS